jgi:hypothetical protein
MAQQPCPAGQSAPLRFPLLRVMVFALYQGATSVVPSTVENDPGFTPAQFSIRDFLRILSSQGLKECA